MDDEDEWEGCGYSWDHTLRDLGNGSYECRECGAEIYDEPEDEEQ